MRGDSAKLTGGLGIGGEVTKGANAAPERLAHCRIPIMSGGNIENRLGVGSNPGPAPSQLLFEAAA
jgi:hypothetical protein